MTCLEADGKLEACMSFLCAPTGRYIQAAAKGLRRRLGAKGKRAERGVKQTVSAFICVRGIRDT